MWDQLLKGLGGVRTRQVAGKPCQGHLAAVGCDFRVFLIAVCSIPVSACSLPLSWSFDSSSVLLGGLKWSSAGLDVPSALGELRRDTILDPRPPASDLLAPSAVATATGRSSPSAWKRPCCARQRLGRALQTASSGR